MNLHLSTSLSCMSPVPLMDVSYHLIHFSVSSCSPCFHSSVSILPFISPPHPIPPSIFFHLPTSLPPSLRQTLSFSLPLSVPLSSFSPHSTFLHPPPDTTSIHAPPNSPTAKPSHPPLPTSLLICLAYSPNGLWRPSSLSQKLLHAIKSPSIT